MVMPIAQQGAPAKQPMPTRDVVAIIIASVMLLGTLALPVAFGIEGWFEEIAWQIENGDPWFFVFVLSLLSPLALGATIAFTVLRDYVTAAFFLIPVALKWIALQGIIFNQSGFEEIIERLPLTSLYTFIFVWRTSDPIDFIAFGSAYNLEPIGVTALALLLVGKRSSRLPQMVLSPAGEEVVAPRPKTPVAAKVALGLAFFFPLAGLVIGYVAKQDLRRQNPAADTSMATAAIVSSWIALAVFTLLAMYLVLES